MMDIINEKCFFYEIKDKKEYSDSFIFDYYTFLLNKKNLIRSTTITVKLRNIHKYWLYAIHFPPKSEEISLHEYIAQFYRDCTIGYSITKTITNNCLTTSYVSKQYKPSNSSNCFSDLSEYFKFLYNKNINPKWEKLLGETPDGFYMEKLNLEKLAIQEKHNKGNSYGLRAKGLMRPALAERYTVFDDYNQKCKKGGVSSINNKHFPLQLFDELLKLTKNNPRRRLLYLLCGAYGARLSQACSLTVYDVDVKNRRVYLTDPRSEQKPSYEGVVFLEQEDRYSILKDKIVSVKRYNKEINKYIKITEPLDFINNPRLKELCNFKNPIPILKDKKRNLYCIDDKYEDLFFETFDKLNKLNDSSFPFVIQTQNNTIPTRKDLSDEMTKDFKKLNEKYPKFNLLNLKKKYHSLRHMFGVYMASIAHFISDESDKEEIETLLSNGKFIRNVELWRRFTASKMGHTNINSVDIYFNPDDILYELALEYFKERKNLFKDRLEKKKLELLDYSKEIETDVKND